MDSFEDSQLVVRKQGPLTEKMTLELQGEESKRKCDEDRSKKGRAFTESKFQKKDEDNGKEEEESKDEEATKYYERQQEEQEEEKDNVDQKTEEPMESEEGKSSFVVDKEDDAIQIKQ